MDVYNLFDFLVYNTYNCQSVRLVHQC